MVAQALRSTVPSDPFALRAKAIALQETMTDVLKNIPNKVAWSYSHRMWVSDVLLSLKTRQFVIKISGAAIDTRELVDFLRAGMVTRGCHEDFVLELEP